jgi:hypothetical protein
MKNALKTNLTDLINWAAGTIIVGIGAGQFRAEVNSVIQQVLEMGADRARLNEFEYIERVLKSNKLRDGQREVLNYIDRKRETVAKQWDFEF